jgi:hypothetical protein
MSLPVLRMSCSHNSGLWFLISELSLYSECRLSVPDHKELAKGTLRALIRQAGITPDEFAALL